MDPKGLQKWLKSQCQSQVIGGPLRTTKNKKAKEDLMHTFMQGMKLQVLNMIKIICYRDKIEGS